MFVYFNILNSNESTNKSYNTLLNQNDTKNK